MPIKSATFRTSFAKIDQFCKGNSQLFENQGRPDKPGRKYTYKDKEILKMLFIRDKEKIPSNRELVGFLKTYRSSWFKKIPDHSTLSRREKRLLPVQNLLRESLLKEIVSPQDKVRLVDSTPISVVRYERSGRYKLIPEATYGYCSTKDEKYKGFKLHLLATYLGIPTDFELTPANVHDIKVLEELIWDYYQLIVIGDKGYLDKKLKDNLLKEQKLLITPYKKKQEKSICPKH